MSSRLVHEPLVTRSMAKRVLSAHTPSSCWQHTHAQLAPAHRPSLQVGGFASEADPPVHAFEVWDARTGRVTAMWPEPFLAIGLRVPQRRG